MKRAGCQVCRTSGRLVLVSSIVVVVVVLQTNNARRRVISRAPPARLLAAGELWPHNWPRESNRLVFVVQFM